MADLITPSNPNVPTQPAVPGNVASLATPSTLSNLQNSISPSTFGDQAKDIAKQQVIKAATQSTIAKLYKEKADLIQEGIQLDINHQLTLQKLEVRHTPKKQVQNGQTVDIPAELNDQQYEQAVDAENKNYDEAKKNIQERKDANQKAIDDYLKDPFKKQKDAKKKRQANRQKRIKRNKEEERKARKALAKTVFQNAKKSLVPILTLVLTNQIAKIIAGNNRIKKLVEDTNAIILDANASGDATKLNSAKLARDNAIRIIQDNEDKINKINAQIKRISIYITIFSTILSVADLALTIIPLPIPPNIIKILLKIIEKVNKILIALSALIPIVINVLDKVVSILQDYKSQLLDINGQLESAAATTNSDLSSTSGKGSGGSFTFGSTFDEYKGFKFAIREDTSFGGITVGGFKRHYAVAIDKFNVDVLKSEYSFTLDPNDLISQLKLVIDQQNLQA
jgi:hypothetical protein